MVALLSIKILARCARIFWFFMSKSAPLTKLMADLLHLLCYFINLPKTVLSYIYSLLHPQIHITQGLFLIYIVF